MTDLPTFADATDAAEQAVRSHGRTLIPWLPDPPQCPECAALTYADVTFDPREAYHVTTWYCAECDTHRPRDPEYGPDRVPGPRPAGGLDLPDR